MPSGFRGERSAALFHTRVLPVCRRIPATAHNCNCRLHANGREKLLCTHRPEGENVLPWPQTTLHVRVDCKAEQKWHQRIPLFAVFCLVDLMLHTIPILPHVARGSGVGRSNEWQETSEAWDTVQRQPIY